MRSLVVAFVSGFVFAIGLAISGMTRPNKVLAFLDITGRWDPGLALVMAGAVAMFTAAVRASRRMHKPVLVEAFAQPSAARIDARLVLGAVVFGVGWGLAGYCPGPALSSLGAGIPQSVYFVGAMIAGIWLVRAVDARRRGAGDSGAPRGAYSS